MLGPLEVVDDEGSPLALGGGKPRALLTALLLEPNRVVSTDRLIDALWGDDPPASGAAALQVHVHALRKALGADRIATRPPGYALGVAPGELDSERFEQLARDGALDEALALWRGPALADLADEPFARSDAARLDERRLTVLEERLDRDLGAGRHAAVAAELDGLVAAHPHRERLQALRMLALYRAGRQADALTAYREARAALDELGLEPSTELRALERRMLEQDPALDAAPTTGPADAGLPVDATALVGRDLELAAIDALLARPETRLLTLTGPGGTGKTRLAVAVARAAGDAVFVDLSAVTDHALVLPTVAHALGADEVWGGDAVVTVVAALGARPRLLVLDNLEQVIDAASAIARLLDAAPTLRILATSRGPLRIAPERVYTVPPLVVPAADDATADGIRSVASVRLYAERASATDPAFVVSDENAAAVARICRALDGLPLALELAAARIRTLGAEGTAARLGERLALLSRGARDLPERQRSLRATIDWSVHLLDEDARTVLAAVGAFSGGASLDAIEAVAGPGTDVPTALDDLLDAALVSRAEGPGGATRFTTLETVREYATELLASSGRERELRDRHLDWFLHEVEGDDVYWRRNTDAAWLERIAFDHDNCRAGLAHARAIDDPDRELRLANGLRYFWRVRGYIEEGRRRLDECVQLADRVAPALQARTLGEAGVMAFAAGDFGRARELWTAALPLVERFGEPRELARALGELGACDAAEGDLRAAVPLYEASLVQLSATDDRHGVGVMLANLANAYEGLGELEKARAASIETLRLQEEIGDDDGIAISNLNLASLEATVGELEEAGRHLHAALDAAQRLGYREGSAYAVGIAAQIAAARGDLESAGVLAGAFEAQFGALGSAPQAAEADRARRVRALVAETLDLEPLLARGRGLTLEESVAVARSATAGRGGPHPAA